MYQVVFDSVKVILCYQPLGNLTYCEDEVSDLYYILYVYFCSYLLAINILLIYFPSFCLGRYYLSAFLPSVFSCFLLVFSRFLCCSCLSSINHCYFPPPYLVADLHLRCKIFLLRQHSIHCTRIMDLCFIVLISIVVIF